MRSSNSTSVPHALPTTKAKTTRYQGCWMLRRPSLETMVAGSRREASPRYKGWSRPRSSFAERIQWASTSSRTRTKARFSAGARRRGSGQWAVHRGEVMSRDSLSGIVVDRNAVLLMTYPDGQSKDMRNFALPIAEALLIPFHLGGEPIGVIWIISHDATRRFDTEDRRLITSLARFAGIAYHLNNEEWLASKLVATQRLQEISAHLLSEDKIELLYDGILDAARAIMRSDFASMQKFIPERGLSGELLF